MYVVQYRGADHVSKVNDGLAGGLLYYANPVEALNRHRFVQKLVIWVEPDRRTDYLDQPFVPATEDEIRETRLRS